MEKVIVTGGAGFIGSHTCVELAAAGFLPVIVDDMRNSQVRVLQGLAKIIGGGLKVHHIDCSDAMALQRVFEEERPSGVIHFAADKAVGESVKDPLKYYTNNIGSLLVLLRVMAAEGVHRLVFSSSCTVYGVPSVLPVPESAPDDRAASPYGYTKVVCEQLLKDVVRADDRMQAVMLRYFNPVGAHPSAHIGELPIGVPNNLIPFVSQTAAGLRDQVTVFGSDYDTPDGSCIRDYIHVVDLARAHVQALRWMAEQPAPLQEVFNIGTGVGHSVLDVLETFEEVNGVRVPHIIGARRPGDVPSVFADIAKSANVLGWRAQLQLKDALRDAWGWQLALAKG